MTSLFTSEPILLNLPDAEILYYPHFFHQKEIGIDVIKQELSLFAEGIKWFENV